MNKKFDDIPECIKKRFVKIILIFILLIVVTIIMGIQTRQVGSIILGAAACLGYAYIFGSEYKKISKEPICVFEGICIGMERMETILNMPGRMANNRHKYILQNENVTIEIIAHESLHLYKNQKYRFYLPAGSIDRAGKKAYIKIRQYYGCEMITK
jgi:hypothetical protein